MTVKSTISWDEYRADPGRFFRSWIRVRRANGVLTPFIEFHDLVAPENRAKASLYKPVKSGLEGTSIVGCQALPGGNVENVNIKLTSGMEVVWDPPLQRYGYVNNPDELGGCRYVFLTGIRQYRWGLNPNTVQFKRFTLQQMGNNIGPNFTAFVTTQNSTMPYARNLSDIPKQTDIALSSEFAIRVAPEAPKTQLLVYHDDIVCGVLYKGDLLVDEAMQGLTRDKFKGVKYESTRRLLDLVE